jgi:hypothetical protein
MTFSEIQKNLIGDWSGSNLLRTPWLTPPETVSSSKLRVSAVVKGMFLELTYTWSHESTPHEGLILVGYDESQGAATAAWVDSWHQNSKVMPLEGSTVEQGIDVRGTYQAPTGPDWGWRILIKSASSNDLSIVMYNCPPEGDEELAVHADYTRTRGV